jgi:multidrug efflux pump subunit AcrA (membrane-fusion protein)
MSKKERNHKATPTDNFFRNESLSWAVQEVSIEQPPFLAQFGIYFLLAFLIVSVIYVSVVQVPVTVEGVGKIASENPLLPIRSAVTFTVSEVHVADNQEVKAGETLVSSLENLKQEDAEKLKYYLREADKINSRKINDLCLNCVPIIDNLSRIYLTIRAEGSFLGLISPINDLIRQLRSEIEGYSQIKSSLAGITLQVETAQRKLKQIEARRATKVLAKEVEELNSVVVSGKAQINQRYKEAGRRISDMRSTLKARTKELDDRLREIGRVFTVKAPISGRITNFKIKGKGELVSAGQLLMELVPEKSQFVAQIDILNRDISKIREGDKVIVSIDSLPEVDYGTIDGTLIEINRNDSDESARGQAGVDSQADRAYRAKIKLDKQSLGEGELEKPLLMGMGLRGRVITGKETLLKKLYMALFNIKEQLKAGSP